MNPTLKAAFETAMTEALAQLDADRLDAAEAHLERAHILGQRHVWPHVRAHWWMLVLEWRRRRPLAVAGQLTRIVLGAAGSAVGILPEGNPGSSRVGMFQRREVPPTLRELIGRR